MRRQKMQKQHLLGAGFIATLVAIYPFAANLGVVPQDATQLIKIPPGMASITLPNGTHISLSELQQQVQNNPSPGRLGQQLASAVQREQRNQLQHPQPKSRGGYANSFSNGHMGNVQSGNGFNGTGHGGGWGQAPIN